ncbi:MAG: cytochrome c [Novosphingobium sp.]|uniref:cytochrome c n=1 Tax=Novosphingobium sp. TaxID=1874826 RepID=UPI00391B07DB
MKTARIIALAALATTAFAVQAQTKPKAAKPAAVAAPSPEEIVAARQAAMVMSVGATSAMRSAAANGTPVKNLAFVASGVAKWGAALPAMFAPSTAKVPTRAQAAIWTDPAGFAAKAKDFADATAALAAAAKADDKDAFTAALASTNASCKGCHDSFQAPPPAAKAG